jgi:hypothetical protein
VYTIYGARAELRLRDIERLGCGPAGIVRTLYNGTSELVQLSSQKWSYNAAMGGLGEEITLPAEIVSAPVGSTDGAREFNEGSAEIVANVDKGFMHYLKYFRNDLEVTASIRIESGGHREYGWGVYFEQGRHRCALAGTVVGSEDDAI